MEQIDAIRLNFSPESLVVLNITLGIIMFGVALELKISDFKRLLKIPKLILVGLTSQLILLPLFTLILVQIMQPKPSFALGMFLLAACPGGNVSNFMSALGKGNIALSVSLTAIVNVLALAATPLNFAFWSSWYEPAQPLLKQIALSPIEMIRTMLMLLIIPTIVGMLFGHYLPNVTKKIARPIRTLSIIIFGVYVVIGFYNNFEYFLGYVKYVVLLVFLHNTLALLTGFSFATLMGLKERDRRSITIETGIQNSGLALIIIFNFFDGMGGMALMAGWWSIWHLTIGTSLAGFWSRRPPKEA